MELQPYEVAKKSLEYLIRTNDWKIVSIAKNCSFVKLNRNKYPNTEWPKIETQISNWILDEVMGIYTDILLYRKQPSRVLEYIKSRLRGYPVELHGSLIELLNYCINDEKRIPPNDPCISYLRNELESLEASELGIGERLKGDDHSSFFGIEPSGESFLEAWMYATGYKKSEKEEIDEISKRYSELTGRNIKSESLPPQPLETKTDRLSVPQIALIHVYEGIQITRENAGGIAGKYGYTAKTSGEGLFQDYTTYCSTANRKGKPIPCTPKKLINKIKLFESVANLLSNNSKQRAIDEINILKTILENEYQ